MKFKLCCFLIILVHPCLGQSSTEASEGTDAWGSFLIIDRDIPIITPENNPTLRQKVSRTLIAYQKFRSLIKDKQDSVGANFVPDYFSQLNRYQQVLHSMIGRDTLAIPEDMDSVMFDPAIDHLD